jgi:hypothetical protein
MPLPDELRALYRTMRAPVEPPEDDQDWDEDDDEDWDEDDDEPGEWLTDGMLGELLNSLDGVHIADAATRSRSWGLARKAVITPPGAAVQQLVGSPGWIVFGDDHGDNRYAIDMTPGPGGNLGQVIALSVHQGIGACLMARSLTDFVQGRFAEDVPCPGEAPVIADVYPGGQQAIEAVAHPDLEVLAIIRKGPKWEGEPFSLAPLAGLPKLRTLCADPESLADPLQITELATLEYLELGPRDWRALLDARAVPESLLAADIVVWAPAGQPRPDPAGYVALANEILALWNGPQITTTVIDGQLE